MNGQPATTRARRFLLASIPAAVALVGALTVAIALGGPIAGALAAFAFGSALLVNGLIMLAMVVMTRLESRSLLLLAGTGSYIVSVLLIFAAWSFFGPSQIM